MRTLLLVSVLAVATSGCKDKPKRKSAPVNPSTPTGTSGGSAGQAAPDLQLPHSEAGGPPKKTTAPLAEADLEKLSKMTFPGFETVVRSLGPKAVEVRQITKDHPRLWATITIQHCLDCVPMELDKWKAKLDELRVLLGPLKDAPGVTFELGQIALAGAPAIYTYQLGNSNGVDGDNKIPVIAEPKVMYSILDRQGEKANPTVVLRKIDANGAQPVTTYSKRVFDCNAKTFAEIAQAPGIAELKKATKPGAPTLAAPVAASADEAILVQACRGLTGAGLNYAFTDALALYFNDGVNQIRIVAEYKDDPASVEELERIAPKDDLAMLALSFLDVYTHAW